jgi:hypothetical protein
LVVVAKEEYCWYSSPDFLTILSSVNCVSNVSFYCT